MPPATKFPSENENSPTMNLSEDVVSNILLRLPVRSLLRCKSVCKDWYSLINSSLFKDTYLALQAAVDDDQIVGLKVRVFDDNIQPRSCTLYVTSWYGDYKSLAVSAWDSHSVWDSDPSSSLCISDDFEIPGSYYRIVNHVNGIVCFISGSNWFDITLVNPALREIRKLPNPHFDLDGFKIHPSRTGFGYDVVSDDYKVVVIVTVWEGDFGSPYQHIVMVYLLSTNSWKILGDMSEFVSRHFECVRADESVFCHGSIHFCVGCRVDDDEEEDMPFYWILAFDVTNEVFREIPFPLGWSYFSYYADSHGMFPHLFMVGKSTLALVNSTNETSYASQLEVWVMEEYGDSDSWTKRCLINNLPEFRWAICFVEKDKLLLQSAEGYLICYDLLKGQLDEPEETYPISGLHLVTGHESLVSVKQVL